MNKERKAALHEEILRLLRIPLEDKIEQQRRMAASHGWAHPNLEGHRRVREEFMRTFETERQEAIEMIEHGMYAETRKKLEKSFERLRDIAATIHPHGDCLETDGAAQWFSAFMLPFPHQYPDDDDEE